MEIMLLVTEVRGKICFVLSLSNWIIGLMVYYVEILDKNDSLSMIENKALLLFPNVDSNCFQLILIFVLKFVVIRSYVFNKNILHFATVILCGNIIDERK